MICTPADGTAEVQGDRQKLASLVGNLLDNAVRYAPDASAIDVTLREERGAVTLEVCDEGPGIPEDLRARVFESYYRIPGSTGGGSGLGLAIVCEVARTHGARVEIRDGRGGKGTAVLVDVPASVAEKATAPPPPLPEAGGSDSAAALLQLPHYHCTKRPDDEPCGRQAV